jgi:hypothetical protein
MSQFKFTFITNDGSSLARIAKSVDKKIVFTRAITSDKWDSCRGDLGVKDKRWFNGPVGEVTTVSVSGNIKVKASFNSDELDFPVKSVGLCAQLEKEGESPTYDPKDDVVFAIVSDDNSCFVSTYSFDVIFDLSTQALGMVDAVGGGAPDDPVTHEDLDDYYTKSQIDSNFLASATYDDSTHTLTLTSADGTKVISLELT